MRFVLVSTATKYTAQTIKYSSNSWTSSRHTVRCTEVEAVISLSHYSTSPSSSVLTCSGL